MKLKRPRSDDDDTERAAAWTRWSSSSLRIVDMDEVAFTSIGRVPCSRASHSLFYGIHSSGSKHSFHFHFLLQWVVRDFVHSNVWPLFAGNSYKSTTARPTLRR